MAFSCGTFISRIQGALVLLDSKIAEQVVAGDLDGNGQVDMILSITGVGTTAFKNLTNEETLDQAVALDLTTGNIDGN